MYPSSQSDVTSGTHQTYLKVFHNLREFFREDIPLSNITKETAAQFGNWLRTAPLNRRSRNPKPYGQATVNRRISTVKQIFRYAEKMEWMGKNPFEILKGGESVNPDKMEYVPIEKVLRVMEYSPLKWRVLMAIVRFCGVRGSSEVYHMECSDIHWSSPAEPGWISIKAGKNRRHGRRFRMVPMCPIVEQVLSDWFHETQESEPRLFPGMKAKQNFSVMTKKLAVRALGECWLNPWYNLRKSFCCDLLLVVRDIATYEEITDHSYTVAMKHYQIMTKGRNLKGIEEATTLFSNITFSTPSKLAQKQRGHKRGYDGGIKRGAQCVANNCKEKNEVSQVFENRELVRTKNPACDDLQTGELGTPGLEPGTSALSEWSFFLVYCLRMRQISQKQV
ncbi:MAG: site-specific integrase [Planctomycetia bacterium]|nr:site-specific integrase [Planctomycetia bacterium]